MTKTRVNKDLDDAGSDTSSVYKPLPRRSDQLRPGQQRYGDAHEPRPPERESRSARIRREKRRTIAPRQEAIIKHVLTKSGCRVTPEWKNKEEPFHVCTLDPSTTIPLASSQRWCGTMRQVRNNLNITNWQFGLRFVCISVYIWGGGLCALEPKTPSRMYTNVPRTADHVRYMSTVATLLSEFLFGLIFYFRHSLTSLLDMYACTFGCTATISLEADSAQIPRAARRRRWSFVRASHAHQLTWIRRGA